MNTAPTPKKRTARTLLQVVIAVALAIPTALGALEAANVSVPAEASALLIGVPAALVVLVSAAQNAWDTQQGNG
jgi:hypothetical protein